MHCIVIGRGVWLFSARNKREGRRRANQILSLEVIAGDRLSSFGPGGAWEATKVFLNEKDIQKMLEVAPKHTIVEIKKIRYLRLDAIYMTRRQKEREAKTRIPS